MASTNCVGPKNIAIVATENNTIYVYDVTPGDPIQECYHTNTNAAGENAIPFTDLIGSSPECTNLVPQEGITGTPAIDATVTPPALYFVSAVKTGPTSWDFKLNVMRLDSGNQAGGSPIPLSSRIIAQTGGVNNSPFSAINENQRAGLALFHPPSFTGVNLYVAFGSHCDSTPYQGYVAGFQYKYGNPSTLSNLGVFQSENVSGGSAGGIWMSGAAPAVDSNGNVYVAVGNGLWSGQANTVPAQLGQSVVQLKQSGSVLTAVDYYTPNDYTYLNSGSNGNSVCVTNNTTSCPTQFTFQLTSSDYDVGSAGMTLISPVGSYTSQCGTSNGELVAGGKEGVLYGICYNPSPGSLGTMGGLDSCGYNFTSACISNLNSVAAITACTQASAPTSGKIAQCFYGTPNLGNGSSDFTGTRSTPAFWGGSSSSPQNYAYLAGDVDRLRAYQFSPGGTFGTPGALATTPNTYGYPGATPSISWNGVNGDTTTGLVWAINSAQHGTYKVNGDKTTPAGPATLFGYKAIPDSLGTRLTNEFNSSNVTPPSTNPGPGAVKFTVPTIAGGLVFVGGGEANPVYYAPGQNNTPGANCTPSATGGNCRGGFYIYGTTTR